MKPYYSHAGIEIFHGDCRGFMRGLYADVIVTDPPYSFHARGGGFHKSDNPNYGGGRTYLGELQTLACTEFDVAEFFQEAPTFYIVACCNKALMRDYLNAAEGRGLLTDVHVWVKANPIPAKSTHYLHDLEYVIVSRPERSHFDGSGPFDDYRKAFAGSGEDTKLHPAEKPLALMAKYIRVCCPLNGVVLDPYMGSGTTLVAAVQNGRRAIGIEIEEKYCEIAAKRLSQEVFDFGNSGAILNQGKG